MAAAAAVHDEQLNGHLCCSICIDLFTDPRALPCLHTFCFRCIAQWYKDKRPEDKVACPECRREFAIPDSGINGLQKNFLIGNLLCMNEVNKKHVEFSVEGKKKEACERFDSNLKGEQGHSDLNSNLHSRLTKSLQKLVSRNGFKSGYDKCQSIFCDKHKDKEIELFCLEDQVAMCMTCYATEHSSHSCNEMKKVAADFRVQLEHNLQTIATVESDLSESLTMLNSIKLSFVAEVDVVGAKICERADDLIGQIKTHARKLVSDLHAIKANHEREIENLTQDLTYAKQLLTSFTTYCDELLLKGSDFEISREAESLCERTAELIKLNNFEEALTNVSAASVRFSPSNVNFGDTKNIVGHVNAESSRSPEVPLTPTMIHDEAPYCGVTPVLTRTLLEDKKTIAGLALMNDELFVVRHQVQHVSVYDSTTLQFKRNISVPKLGQWPSGLAACPFNKLLFISDWINKCVHRIDITTDKITRVKLADWTQACSVNSRNNVLVVCYWLSCKVKEYTSKGKLVRQITDSNDLMQAVETKNGTLVVSRNGPIHGIAELALDGTVLRSYGNRAGSRPGQMSYPTSVVVSSRGAIIVADMNNNRIQVLDALLTTARSLPIPSHIVLDKPFALCYDESRGRLFVGEKGGQCRVLVFDHVTNLEAMF